MSSISPLPSRRGIALRTAISCLKDIIITPVGGSLIVELPVLPKLSNQYQCLVPRELPTCGCTLSRRGLGLEDECMLVQSSRLQVYAGTCLNVLDPLVCRDNPNNFVILMS